MDENKTLLNELPDEDLNEVAGGGTYTKDGYLKTTIGYSCSAYQCECGETGQHIHPISPRTPISATCGFCRWHSTLRCNNPINKR